MKKIFQSSLFLLGALLLVFSCKKEVIDTAALTDFPPGIFSISPSDNGKVNQGDFDVTVKYLSGTASPLASATVTLKDAAGTQLATKTESLSGTSDSLTIPGSEFGAATLPLGQYTLEISVTDSKGKTQNRTTHFEVYIQPKIGIIGSATPKGWAEDTDMTEVSPGTFEIIIPLVAGEVKFRADDAWTVNWGGASFPSGVGTQDGPNIPVPAGLWRVTFVPATGTYNFAQASTFASKISGLYLLGSFNDYQDQAEAYKFSLTADNTWVLNEVLLKPGDKFRFSEGPVFMGKNWGDNEPDGKADEFGKVIVFGQPEGEAYYKVTFNDKTRLYSYEFVKYPVISIIGSATPGGWNTDTDLSFKGNGIFEAIVTLTDGEAKFRANHDWGTNWGGSGFPTGAAELNGANIPITAGTYKVTFDRVNLTYKFEPGINSIGIIGDATPGGWGAETQMHDNGDGTYSIVIGLGDGQVKFRANNGWDTNWGGDTYPIGTGVPGGNNINVTKGIYVVTFTLATAEYKFETASIGLIGSATPGGWNSDTDMTEDGSVVGQVILNGITLVDGEAKFRVNDDWKFNWGDTAFPTGIGTQNGPNIPVPAGTYNVTFNVNTGEYSFN